jgi:hypothetical protein
VPRGNHQYPGLLLVVVDVCPVVVLGVVAVVEAGTPGATPTSIVACIPLLRCPSIGQYAW